MTTINGLRDLTLSPGDPLPTEDVKASVLVTPALAHDMLTRFSDPKKRHVRPARVEMYAEDMKRGLWHSHKGSIEFTKNGSILLSDGHHRLHSVVRSGVSIRFEVWFNAPVEVRRVEGNRLSRSIADTLLMEGCVDYSTQIASAARDVSMHLQTVGTDTRWLKPHVIAPSGDDVTLMWMEDPDLWNSACMVANRAMRGFPKGVPTKAVTAFTYLSEHYFPGSGFVFTEEVGRGGGPTANERVTTVNITSAMRTFGGSSLEWDRRVIETLVRAFNANLRGSKSYQRVGTSGAGSFSLTPIGR